MTRILVVFTALACLAGCIVLPDRDFGYPGYGRPHAPHGHGHPRHRR